MAAFGVVTAIANPALEAVVVAALAGRADTAVIVRRCVEVADVLAVAASGAARVVLVGEGLAGIDADIFGTLRSYGVLAVAVCERGARWPAAYRIPVVLDAAAPADELADGIVRAARDGVAASEPLPEPDLPPRPADLPPPARGRVIAVWGPTGAPGRSTVALGLADEASRAGQGTLLIDADVYGGAIATMLGLLDESPGVAAACRAAASGTLDLAALARTCLQVGPALRVLTGITRTDRWPELRPAAIEAVLEQARGLGPLTVVDCGFSIEHDEELAYDTLAPRRNGATTTVLEHADRILLVAGADPVGVTRGIRSLQELRELLPGAQPTVVVNKVRSSLFHGDPAAQLHEAFERFAGAGVAATLPWDPKACDTAALRGRMLSEAAPSSPLRRALEALATQIAGSGPPSARTSRRRGRSRRALP